MDKLQLLMTDVLVIAAFIFLVISTITGLAFLLLPHRAVGMERQVDRRFSFRKALKPLEIPRNTERFFYRHHRLTGGFIMLLAALFLWISLVEGEGGRIAAWASQQSGGALLGTWATSLGWLMVTLNFGALLFGTVMLVRPSALKNLETLANRWISTRRASRPLDSEHDPLGRFAARQPRVFGGLVLLGSLFIFVNLISLLN